MVNSSTNNSIKNRRLISRTLKVLEKKDSFSTLSSSQKRYQISKFTISAVITFVIILTQFFIFFFYFSLDTDSIGKSSNSKTTSKLLDKEWKCMFSQLGYIYDLAYKFDLDLIIVDPDVLSMIDDLEAGNKLSSITFTSKTKNNQESSYKSIVHLAIINETSGGQPNLKLFFNALKHNGYFSLKYIETDLKMQPEVYVREPHLFDDMSLDGTLEHRHSHDSNEPEHLTEEKEQHEIVHGEISKIYTEFISHIFILNKTTGTGYFNEEEAGGCEDRRANAALQYVVTHIFVLYNYEFIQDDCWIQSGLLLDEFDKHKLLSYNVHSFDFKIPLEHYRIHPKRKVAGIVQPSTRHKRKTDLVQVFEPRNNRELSFVNNSYIPCTISYFNISGLREGTRPMSNYLSLLDRSHPIPNLNSFFQKQIMTALDFMDVFSVTYSNFSYWLTGSSLLSYYRYCDLASVPIGEGLLDSYNNQSYFDSYNNIIINLEFGLFSSEINEQMIKDLADSHSIGVNMLSNWRKDKSSIIFQLKDSTQLIINLYLYELREDFQQYLFVTHSTMVMSNKLKRKLPVTRKNRSKGLHVFKTENLELCWTRIKSFNPFKVPCNVYDHLRRIYII